MSSCNRNKSDEVGHIENYIVDECYRVEYYRCKTDTHLQVAKLYFLEIITYKTKGSKRRLACTFMKEWDSRDTVTIPFRHIYRATWLDED